MTTLTQVPQARGPCNCTYGVTASATFNAMLNITDQTIPRNSGCYRPIQLIVPPGTVVNVKAPGTQCREATPKSTNGLSMSCLAVYQVRCAGPRRRRRPVLVRATFFSEGYTQIRDQYYANYHIDGCGWGGKATGDGNHTQCPINGNCRNTPVEVFETRYPWLTKTLSHRRGFGWARSTPRGLWQRKDYRSTRTGNHGFQLYGQA